MNALDWLRGKKTIGTGIIALLYLVGCWLGWYELDSKVLFSLGAGGLIFLRLGVGNAAKDVANKALVAFGLACLLCTACNTARLEPGGAYAPATTNSAGQVIYTQQPDLAFYTTDAAYDLAYSAIDAAFKFERDNRAMLWQISPQIKHSLDSIRPQAVEANARYLAARAAYMAHPVPANLGALQRILSEVQSLTAAARAITLTNAPASPTAH
jgi:hypothetical protein